MAPSVMSLPPKVEDFDLKTPKVEDLDVKPLSILKRRRSDDFSQPPTPKSPSKRPRVAFEVKIEDSQADEKDVALLREELALAIRNKGSDNGYLAEIQSYFEESDDVASSKSLRKYLLALTSNANLLNRVPELVNALINCHWLGRDDGFVTIYTKFLGHLVSSHGRFLDKVLKMLISNFAHISTSLGSSPPMPVPSRSTLQARVHTALKYILSIIPSGSTEIAAAVSKHFPPPHDTIQAHSNYVRSVFKMIDYAPELRNELYSLVMERTIKLDVQVQMDVEDFDDDADVLGLNQTPDQDDDALSEVESEASDEDAEEMHQKSMRAAVDKVDYLLDDIFAYWASQGNKSLPDAYCLVVDQLMSQFRSIVLPTYRSRHVQFLIFHFAQTSPRSVQQFIDHCMALLSDKARPVIARSSAAAYLASFIARGARIPAQVVLHVFDKLAAYAESLRVTFEPSCRGPDLRRYNVYYSAVQAMIYIFCFRWRDFLDRRRLRLLTLNTDSDDEEDLDLDIDELLLSGCHNLVWANGVKEAFLSNIYSSLNPLKICAPEITDEFARITHHLGFMYIFQVINSNKRIRLHSVPHPISSGTSSPLSPVSLSVFAPSSRENSLTNLHGERHLQLDAYFPFDPYRLPRSKHWLEGDYNDWRGVPGMEEALISTALGRQETPNLLDEGDNDSENGSVLKEQDDRTATPE